MLVRAYRHWWEAGSPGRALVGAGGYNDFRQFRRECRAQPSSPVGQAAERIRGSSGQLGPVHGVPREPVSAVGVVFGSQ